MATVPVRESGDPFGHKEANQPFAIEDAVVDGSGNLDVTVGDGRITWGDVVYELDTGGTGTIVTETSIPAAADDYYVVVDFAAGTPTLDITTTPHTSNTDADLHYLGYVTVDATPVVTTLTDLRTIFPSSGGHRVFNGSAAAPAYAFANGLGTGLYYDGSLNFATGGTLRARVGTASPNGFVVEDGMALFHGGNDATLSDGTGQAQFGPSGAANIGIDGNEIIARNGAGGTATLNLNIGGGPVSVGGTLDAPAITVDNLTLNGSTVDASGTLTLEGGGDIRFEHNGGLRGLFDQSIEAWRFWNGGTEVVRIDNGNLDMISGGDITGALIISANEFNATDGGPDSDPPFTFSGDTDTGLYRHGAGQVGISSNGNTVGYFDIHSGFRTLHLGGESNDWIAYDPFDEYHELVSGGNAVFAASNSGIFTCDSRRIVFQDHTTGPTDRIDYDDGDNHYRFYADNAVSNSHIHVGDLSQVSDASVKDNMTPVGSVRRALRDNVNPIEWDVTTRAEDKGRAPKRRVSAGTAQDWQQAMGEQWPGVYETDGLLALSTSAVDAALLAYCHDLSDALDEAVARIESLENA